jgi:dTDP-4-dehydrorhamnose reductase
LNEPLSILVTGKGGQLASECEKTCPRSYQLTSLNVRDLDITDVDQIEAVFDDHHPDVVINTAAYTAVDLAETDVERAHQVNAVGPKLLAQACSKRDARLIQISTDFVFDGASSKPYQADHPTRPLSVYGKTKRDGELSVCEFGCDNTVVLRTAWLYSSTGNNFVKTMLRLMSEKNELSVIADQIGSPTWARGLAQCIWGVVEKPKLGGFFHWSDGGVASWYDFAVAIQELGLEKQLLKREIPIVPIPTTAYPTPAERPSYSVMDKNKTLKATGLILIHWRKQLSQMMDELK